MRTLLIALAAAGALALATPALAGPGQTYAAPVVYYSPYTGNGYYVPAITHASGFNRGWFGQPIYYGHPRVHNGRCDNRGLHHRLYGNPGLHRGHYKKNNGHRRHAVRHHRPDYWFFSNRKHRDHDRGRFDRFDDRRHRNSGFRGHHSGHSRFAKHDRKHENKNWKNGKHGKHDGDRNHKRDRHRDGNRHHRR